MSGLFIGKVLDSSTKCEGINGNLLSVILLMLQNTREYDMIYFFLMLNFA